nr:DUF3265 domain-containing protein [Vibrio coralliilyticus]
MNVIPNAWQYCCALVEVNKCDQRRFGIALLVP